ncbi:hypothetical protein HMPREF1430_00608 [Helicobacter pylori GAM96Ai]|uniref:hypothetical protein n=1 Tax=Helicobacter pylori TaxID=210 RepID=UPI0002BC5CFF|nr:hypothetical protein [Helicobacter pylori]EMH43760.1 hypothetical protein HMPREF1430_00608 [Helicobacter pylori GAM96Ai]
MRQEHETAASFNQLQEITQAIMLKKGASKNATNQASERTQASENANAKAHTQELEQERGLKPKSSAQAKKGRLNPTKKAFSERQITAFRDNSQASELTLKEHTESETEKANKSNLKAEPSNKAFKPGLATHQSNQKGGKNEA